jgi:hypothetical protein
MINSTKFIEYVIEKFPELKTDLAEDAGFDTLQVSTFCDYTQKAIDRGDLDSVENCFDIAHRVLKDGDDSMKNAIHVSFLEHLDFRGRYGGKAFSLMSADLAQSWTDINQYMESLLQGRWEWKKPRLQK